MVLLLLHLHTMFCSKYDLYSKSKIRIDVEKVKPYYLSLIEKVNNTLWKLSCLLVFQLKRFSSCLY